MLPVWGYFSHLRTLICPSREPSPTTSSSNSVINVTRRSGCLPATSFRGHLSFSGYRFDPSQEETELRASLARSNTKSKRPVEGGAFSVLCFAGAEVGFPYAKFSCVFFHQRQFSRTVENAHQREELWNESQRRLIRIRIPLCQTMLLLHPRQLVSPRAGVLLGRVLLSNHLLRSHVGNNLVPVCSGPGPAPAPSNTLYMTTADPACTEAVMQETLRTFRGFIRLKVCVIHLLCCEPNALRSLRSCILCILYNLCVLCGVSFFLTVDLPRNLCFSCHLCSHCSLQSLLSLPSVNSAHYASCLLPHALLTYPIISYAPFTVFAVFASFCFM